MIVAGVMSGTSADGIDVALVRLTGRGFTTRVRFLGHAAFAYPAAVRRQVLAAANASQIAVADLARLNFLLGELYAEAVLSTAKRFRRKVRLVGCHGQTLYHQGEPSRFLGQAVSATWQTGEAAILAARVGVPVISDFRPADMGAGGTGAPLVPFFDYLVYRHRSRGRILQNIGGIANLTAIPAAAAPEKVLAFDTGPGNMVVDAVMERLYGRTMDRDGRVAARGAARENVVAALLRSPFFPRRPPKSAGREEFGSEFLRQFLRLCRGARKEDIVATATVLTARSIAVSLQRFVLARGNFSDFILSGGGARNRTLVKMLADEITPLGLGLHLSDDFGVPSKAKEAAAFAVLAYQTWQRQPSNLPSATGAGRAVILGKVSF